MNLFDVIDAGHFQKTVGEGQDKGKQVCREDSEFWPCAMVLAARAEGEKQRKADRGVKKKVVVNTPEEESLLMDEPEPIITDKRAQKREEAAQRKADTLIPDAAPGSGLFDAPPPGGDMFPGEVEEDGGTTDEAMARVDRIQELREKGRASLDGGPPLSNDEQAELLRLQAEQEAADKQAEAGGTLQARTAFLVIVGYDGSAYATHDVNAMLEIDHEASIDEMYAGATLVTRDIEASLAAKHVVFGMQQGVQQLAARQRDLSAAATLQGRGINPRQLRRG